MRKGLLLGLLLRLLLRLLEELLDLRLHVVHGGCLLFQLCLHVVYQFVLLVFALRRRFLGSRPTRGVGIRQRAGVRTALLARCAVRTVLVLPLVPFRALLCTTFPSRLTLSSELRAVRRPVALARWRAFAPPQALSSGGLSVWVAALSPAHSFRLHVRLWQ